MMRASQQPVVGAPAGRSGKAATLPDADPSDRRGDTTAAGAGARATLGSIEEQLGRLQELIEVRAGLLSERRGSLTGRSSSTAVMCPVSTVFRGEDGLL